MTRVTVCPVHIWHPSIRHDGRACGLRHPEEYLERWAPARRLRYGSTRQARRSLLNELSHSSSPTGIAVAVPV